MSSLIITARWSEPCPGEDAKVARLSEEESAKVGEAIDWLEKQCADEWGDTIPRIDLHPTAAEGGDLLTLAGALRYVADTCRYTSGEGIYEEDCPAFEALAIERA